MLLWRLAQLVNGDLFDAKSALKWTKSAQKQIEKSDLPVYIQKHWMEELTHRRQRLETKLGK